MIKLNRRLPNYCNIALLIFTAMNTTAWAQPYAETAKGKAFIESMDGQFGYSRESLQRLFSQVRRDEVILGKISRPAEKTTPWHKYRRIFLDDKRIRNGMAFYRRHAAVLNEAYDKYGVSPFIITAIIGVETRYGKVMGKDKVITALSTIGFDYPKREAFFSKELRAYLQMAAIEDFDPMTIKGSYAGAMGMAQFMPSSYLNYAVDYEGDGKRDLWNNPNDAIFSVANYLAEHGWERNGEIISEALNSDFQTQQKSPHKPFATLGELKALGVTPMHDSAFTDDTEVGYLVLDGGETGDISVITHHNFAVITTYNTSPLYAMAVKDLAQIIEYEISAQYVLNEQNTLSNEN